MLKSKKIWCDGKLIEVTDEVYEVYTQGERKDRYFMEDLKIELIKIDNKRETVTIIPSREDSFDRLTDDNKEQFADESEAVEDIALRNVFLHKAIATLSEEDQNLIFALYFKGYTERDYAKTCGVYRNAIHKRKRRILVKLKNILNK